MTYFVEFCGLITVEADNENDAFRKGTAILNKKGLYTYEIEEIDEKEEEEKE